MQKEPPPYVWAVPDEKNILTCPSVSNNLFSLWLTHAGCTFQKGTTSSYVEPCFDLAFLHVLFTLARSARFTVCWWGVPWSIAVPLGVSFQATRYQSTSFPRYPMFAILTMLGPLSRLIFTRFLLPSATASRRHRC